MSFIEVLFTKTIPEALQYYWITNKYYFFAYYIIYLIGGVWAMYVGNQNYERFKEKKHSKKLEKTDEWYLIKAYMLTLIGAVLCVFITIEVIQIILLKN